MLDPALPAGWRSQWRRFAAKDGTVIILLSCHCGLNDCVAHARLLDSPWQWHRRDGTAVTVLCCHTLCVTIPSSIVNPSRVEGRQSCAAATDRPIARRSHDDNIIHRQSQSH